MFKGHIVFGSDNFDLTVIRKTFTERCFSLGRQEKKDKKSKDKKKEKKDKDKDKKKVRRGCVIPRLDPQHFVYLIRIFRTVFFRRKSLRRINPSMVTKRMTLVPMMTRKMVQ